MEIKASVIKKIGWLLFSTLFVLSCSKNKEENNKDNKILARANDKYLYTDQLKNIVPKGVSHNDSIKIVREYIQTWVRQQVVLKKAEDNLSEDQKNVDKKLEEYRNSLITYIYERELIRQKLDTSVSDDEIEKYYKEHSANFQLKDNIIKLVYIKIPANAPKIDKVRNWYKSSGAKERKLLEEYCYQFATDYYFKDEEWLPFDEVQNKIPIETYDQEQFLRNNRFIEIPDSTSIYFVNIEGFKIKESLSPLSFEKDNIRNLIINRRKLELIEEMEKNVYENAIKNNEVRIFSNKK
jgi:hypothetical protein